MTTSLYRLLEDAYSNAHLTPVMGLNGNGTKKTANLLFTRLWGVGNEEDVEP
ncbi:hypothetical protein [Anabaena sp. CCY 0017]|uniref:hypothetical protein n=1 Tax=Anabaena sp. CCY 0017 TaxID=3103866 RepID=UPI0039C7152E